MLPASAAPDANLFPMFRLKLAYISSLTWLLIETIQETADHALRGRVPIRLGSLFAQADRVGAGSVPLVGLVSFFVGLTIALLTGYQLRTFGQEQLVPPLVAIAFTRELGPLMTGIMIAARVGAAFTAELGTMTVSEEVEAIEAMGIGPLRFLVTPRLLAVVALMPSLVIVGNMAAIGGAALISKVVFSISYRFFMESAAESLLMRDIVAGVLKSLLFGLIIGLVACFKGLGVRGGAAGVGEATTSSVVTAIATVIGFDTVFNIVLVSWTA
ncbi:MAG: hypothetical protein JWL90_1575 [Chthoniobacteraceae bacterium]|nr:hypothetical protein [Chthoniobacteraceae bacterium]